jgi:hypothetical protein
MGSPAAAKPIKQRQAAYVQMPGAAAHSTQARAVAMLLAMRQVRRPLRSDSHLRAVAARRVGQAGVWTGGGQ